MPFFFPPNTTPTTHTPTQQAPAHHARSAMMRTVSFVEHKERGGRGRPPAKGAISKAAGAKRNASVPASTGRVVVMGTTSSRGPAVPSTQTRRVSTGSFHHDQQDVILDVLGPQAQRRTKAVAAARGAAPTNAKPRSKAVRPPPSTTSQGGKERPNKATNNTATATTSTNRGGGGAAVSKAGGGGGGGNGNGKTTTALATARLIVSGSHPKKTEVKELLGAYEKGWVAENTFASELAKLLV